MSAEDLPSRAAAAGIPVIREIPSGGAVPLGDGAFLLRRRSGIAEVALVSAPDRATLHRLETSLGMPVVIYLLDAEAAAHEADGDALTLILASAAPDVDGVLMVPGHPAVARTSAGGSVSLRSALPLDSSSKALEGVREGEAGRWLVRRRSQSLLFARRLVDEVPDPAELGLPSAIVAAARDMQGRIAIVGPEGSGRSLVLYSILRRCLSRPGVHVLLVSPHQEHHLAGPGSLVEAATGEGEDLMRLVTARPTPDVVALDLPDAALPDDLRATATPLLISTSYEPVEGFTTARCQRTSSGIRVVIEP